MRVLLIDDEVSLVSALSELLKRQQYSVDCAYDGVKGLDMARAGIYDLLLVDVMLPGMSGTDLVHSLREDGDTTPTLMLTARGTEEDKVLGLDSGADDYLVKPFSFQELIARSRALLRRKGKISGDVLQVGDLILNRAEFRVERSGKKIDLTAKEFALLEYLMVNARRTLTRAMIMEEVWKSPYDGSTNLVDVYIKYVRDKVDTGFPTKLMRTARGIGYVISDN